ncbi:MAG: hypothetical protein CL596_05710 [Alteromonas sp.]|nr:hypothetical protein [Alteromonas sp.]MAY22168.1 hypothetical protein [Flavobacteriaceae bacterium]|tara:strand:- start:51042 stop:51578 length:537 start_codon:yes stop_codon:yes gene_type:complete
MMDKPTNKSTEQKLKHQDKGKKQLFGGGIVVFLIAISPFIFYYYESFPNNTKVWETSFFTIETSFHSINSFVWFLVSKIVPLYLLLMWFFTCKHWWHWIILVPIAMYSFQLWGIINQSRDVDEVELYYLFPLMMVLVPAVYLIRAKLFSKVRGTDLKSFEEELRQKRSFWQQLKDLFQ